MNKSRKLIIYGTGGLGRGTVDLVKSINKHSEPQWELLGFADDNEQDEIVNGYRILGGMDYLLNYQDEINVVLSFGAPKLKRKVYEKLKSNSKVHFPNLIHPGIEVSDYNQFGKGNIISKGVSLSTNITLKDFNLIHYNCSVGHDVSMGDFNSVFPLAALSGYVNFGDSIEMGTNAAIIPNKSIGDRAVVGAGSTIVKDVKMDTTVVGVPGKEI